jgi:hypothetical protein
VEDVLLGDSEFEADKLLTRAIVNTLGDFARTAPEIQLNLRGGVDPAAEAEERAEFGRRVFEEAGRLREENRPRLVRVKERPVIDPVTGVVEFQATEVIDEMVRAA